MKTAWIFLLAVTLGGCATTPATSDGDVEYFAGDAAMRELTGQVHFCRVTEFNATDTGEGIVADGDVPENDYTIVFSRGGLVTSDEYFIYRYDAKGQLQSARSVNSGSTFGRIGRDPDGRITEITNKNQLLPAGDWQRAIIWDAEGRVGAVKTTYAGFSDSYMYSYGTDGLLEGATYNFANGENVVRQDISYRYTAVDEHGNWTERAVTTTHTESGNSDSFRNGIRTYLTIERRRIEYY